ncbi:[formate-C-acetyltransferase]-activating enzyme [Edwardsiella anguillarum]|nr:[formate-C-acetyltransferase]-activating enzyme [Edwardsiella anguillarum]
MVGATPDGRLAGEQLADGGLSPMLGQDSQGPTAVLKSVSKLDNYLLSNGTLLNVKFTPATLEGEAGLNKLADFLHAFSKLKLQHIQFNVVSAETLRAAQRRPQAYAGLVVRVAGYSAFLLSCRGRSRMTLSAVPPTRCETARAAGETACIFNVQRYSLNDGRGIRSVVFLKAVRTAVRGAPILSRSPRAADGAPRAAVPALYPCLNDADECPSGAMERIGRIVTLAQLEAEVMKDAVFFRSSGGGVTLSGGEVLLQAAFATRFLTRLRRLGVRCALETAGDGPASRLLSLASLCDEVLFDLKIMDAGRSAQLLRLNLPRALDNLRLLRQRGIRVIPRLPLIPGYTLSRENLRRALDALAPLGIDELHLLPFHRYGEGKYRLLGQRWAMQGTPAPTPEQIVPLRSMAEAAGYRVRVGG